MSETQRFLEAYKLLEESIRDKTGGSVLDYENRLNRSAEGEKLQVCRILRNYASHHEDGLSFLSLSEMTKFLQKENQKFLSIHTTVETIAVKEEPVYLHTPIKQCMALWGKAKVPFLPVLDNKKHPVVVGILNAESLLNAYNKAERVTAKLGDVVSQSSLKRSQKQIELVHAGDRLDQYTPGQNLILVDETQHYCRVVAWKRLK